MFDLNWLNLAIFILPKIYIWPFEGDNWADVALGENEFNVSDLHSFTEMAMLKSFLYFSSEITQFYPRDQNVIWDSSSLETTVGNLEKS